MKKNISIIALIFLVLLLFSCKGAVGPSGPAGATEPAGWNVMTFQQGVNAYAGCYDVRIWSSTPDSNYGASTTSWVGVESGALKRLIIEFYLDGLLPAGAVIEKATISLKTDNAVTGGQSFSFYEMKSIWFEGEATWNNRRTTIAWNSPGGDFVNNKVSNSVKVTEQYKWYTWTVDKALIEEKATLGTTYGFILVADNETTTYNAQAEFISKENATVADRPVLTIYYS
ncbi:MAG TPA: DNRLRE domain-containing protein, partial [Candidatus Goldiibacteriota bacterium]|nr:DNRLRE domain-containing protein [Candidatus Goldiibacteriota bacterium]